MKKASYLLSAMLMVACLSQPVSAQFEGQITYTSYEYEGEDRDEKDEFNMFITPERILLQGENEYEFMGSLKTEGVLVRLDFKDFVFLTGDDKVLKISKSDITSMMNMFDNGDNTQEKAEDKSEDISYERTGETKTIKGYKSEKFIFRDDSKEDDYMVVWMTKDIDVNWGMLAEPWSGSTQTIIDNFPMSLMFKEKYFPLRMESYDGNKRESLLEASNINESSIARAMVKVPSGVQVLSFQDYLFQKMSEQ
ncbi:hypothetical protein [Fodinibius halophilus]|uniref:DUF4412 domain-containing protein n=1 Tax=Fodinibius halophilus TaxID=1736908 RepID=A0A6M1TA59_9BACT|nr:hypothetical protein [Fodinibius halophilus]NGP89343.1 hypothetical protein [Fodinibius halophilus]